MSDLNGSDHLSEERDPGLAEYLDIVRRRWPFFLVPLVVALGVAVGITLVVPPVFRAVATVTSDNGLRLGVLDKLGDLSAFADQSAQAPDVDTVIELARSGAVRRQAADVLASGLGDGARSAVRNLRVQQVRDSDLVSISVEHTDPRLAAEGANAIARSLIEMSLTDRRRPVSEAREFISSQFVQEARRLRVSEDALVAFKESHGDVALAEETTLNLQKLAELEAQAVDLRLRREEVRGQTARARAKLTRQARISPTQWTPSPLIATLQHDLARLEIELSGLRREFTAQHPSVISTQAKIQETRRRLDAELARSLQTHQYGVDPVYQELIGQIAQAEVAGAALDARAAALRGAITQYEAKVRGVPAREVELARLTRTVQAAEKTYLLLSDKLQNAQIAEASI
ncbi:MAG: GumC family protein, partial [Anaerolineales bacterium]